MCEACGLVLRDLDAASNVAALAAALAGSGLERRDGREGT